MRSRKRLLIALSLIVVALAALVLAPAAFASAGGGTAGFSEGGGGSSFGGGGGGGGRGFALYIVIRLLIEIALLGHGIGALVLIALFAAWWFWTVEEPKMERWWHARSRQGLAHRRTVRKREKQVTLAAAEAADQNDIFAPERVRADAIKLFTDVQLAWSSDDRTTLRRLVAPTLLTEWQRRLDEFERKGWQNKVEPVGVPKVEYVGISRRRRGSGDGSAAGGDQVVVRIEAKLRDYVVDRSGRRIRRDGSASESVRMREFWTLEWGSEHWLLASIESGAEGEHALKDKIVQTEWADTQALRDEAMVEGAVASEVPDGTSIADVAELSFTGDARAAALDLALADGRFAPDILELTARRAVAAWARAVDGPADELKKLASPETIKQLLHPGDPSQQTRLVVRGTQVQRIRITGLDAGAQPPTMAIDVDLRGYRYIEERGTTRVLYGSATRAIGFTERWTLALTEDSENPWQLVGSQTPAGV